MAYSADTITLLSEIENALREYYKDGLTGEEHRFGSVFRGLFRPASVTFSGKECYWQVKSKLSRPTRSDRVGNVAGATPRAFGVEKLKAVFDDETAGNNDFSVTRATAQVSLYDVERAASDPRQYVVNVLPELITDLEGDYEEHMAVTRNLPASGLVGTISNTPKKNNHFTYADAADTPNGTSGVRFILTDGQIAILQKGTIVAVHAAGNASAKFHAIVTDINPSDRSIGLNGFNTTTEREDTSVDISGAAATDEIYLEGMRNQGRISIPEWFADPTASESFFTKDRTLPNNQYLRPTKRTNASLEAFNMGHFNAMGVDLAHIMPRGEVPRGYMNHTTPELVQAIINVVDSKIYVSRPNDTQAANQAALGFRDLPMLYHQHLGDVMVYGDPLAQINKMRLLQTQDWETIVYRGWAPLPRASATGSFYSVVNTSTGRGTLEFAQDWHEVSLDICRFPRRQLEIGNVRGVSVGV